MVDRLFRIVYILIEKSKITAKELAQLLEVSERTIYRDIDKISMAGIPIFTEQGREGGICISPEYVLNKALLTDDDKLQLGAAFHALHELSGSDKGKYGSRLQSFLGNAYHDWLEVDFRIWGEVTRSENYFELLKKAILDYQYVELEYSSSKEAYVKRKIKPFKLCFKNQAWYLYGYCCLREEFRFFKLNRISKLKLEDEHFEFESVGKVLENQQDSYQKSQELIEVVLKIEEQMAFRAYDEFAELIKTKDDNLTCQVQIRNEDLTWFLSCILSYGSCIEVLKPEFLREQVAKSIADMARVYGVKPS